MNFISVHSLELFKFFFHEEKSNKFFCKFIFRHTQLFTGGVLAGIVSLIAIGGMFAFGMYFLLTCQSILGDVDLSKQKVL